MKAILPSHRALCTVAVVILTAGLFPHRAEAEEAAYDTVREASDFAIGGVGAACTITPEEVAMRKVRDGPLAEAQLRKLLREATPAGQLYALFALRQLEASDYATLSAPYRQSSMTVSTISGSIIHTQSISEAVRWIDQYARQMRTGEKRRTPPQAPKGLRIISAELAGQ